MLIYGKSYRLSAKLMKSPLFGSKVTMAILKMSDVINCLIPHFIKKICILMNSTRIRRLNPNR